MYVTVYEILLLATYMYIMGGGAVLKNLFKSFLFYFLTAEIITMKKAMTRL